LGLGGSVVPVRAVPLPIATCLVLDFPVTVTMLMYDVFYDDTILILLLNFCSYVFLGGKNCLLVYGIRISVFCPHF